MKKKLLALIVLGAAVAGNASAIEFNVLGGITSGHPVTSPAPTAPYKSASGVTYGATVGFHLTPGFGIETGLLSVGKKFTQDVANAAPITGIELSYKAYEVPVLFRFTALPIVSFGAGGYYQNRAKTAKMKILGLGTESDINLTDSGFANTDYGLKLNVRAAFPIMPTMKFLLDGSYKKGLKDLDLNTADSVTVKTTEMDLLAGLSFGF